MNSIDQILNDLSDFIDTLEPDPAVSESRICFSCDTIKDSLCFAPNNQFQCLVCYYQIPQLDLTNVTPPTSPGPKKCPPAPRKRKRPSQTATAMNEDQDHRTRRSLYRDLLNSSYK